MRADDLDAADRRAVAIADAGDAADRAIGEAQRELRDVVRVHLVELRRGHGMHATRRRWHEPQQRVERVNACGEQHAAAGPWLHVPAAAIILHPDLDHRRAPVAHRADLAARDHLPRRDHRRREAQGVAEQHANIRLTRRRDDAIAARHCRRHRLLEQDRLARPCRRDRVLFMQVMRRGDHHGVDLRIGQQRSDVAMTAPSMRRHEGRERGLVLPTRSRDPEAARLCQRRRVPRAEMAGPNDPDAQRRLATRHAQPPGLVARRSYTGRGDLGARYGQVKTGDGQFLSSYARTLSNGRLRFHTDRTDVVALLCVRQALSGGVSKLCSSAADYTTMLERRPDLAAVLRAPIWRSRLGEESDRAEDVYPLPVFGIRDGRLTSHWSLTYVEAAQLVDGVPKLTKLQHEAIDMLMSLAEELCFEMTLEPGDVQFINSHVTYHGRTAFEDDATTGHDRLLLRLWLSMPNSRAVPDDHAVLWRDVAAGALRGGIAQTQ
jgi:hypothetical protein